MHDEPKPLNEETTVDPANAPTSELSLSEAPDAAETAAADAETADEAIRLLENATTAEMPVLTKEAIAETVETQTEETAAAEDASETEGMEAVEAVEDVVAAEGESAADVSAEEEALSGAEDADPADDAEAQTLESAWEDAPTAELPVEEAQAEPAASDAPPIAVPTASDAPPIVLEDALTAELPGDGEEDEFLAAAVTAIGEDVAVVEEVVEDAGETEEPLTATREELKPVIEALLFVADEPLPFKQLSKVLGDVPEADVKAALEELAAEYEARAAGLELREIAGGWRISTRPQHHDFIRKYLKSRPSARLSLPALETLAVIAYKQPITVPEILEIRGVSSSSAIKTLLEKRLIVTKGRKETVGKPMMYGTSKEFLIQFGLKDLNELPSIEDFEDLAQ